MEDNKEKWEHSRETRPQTLKKALYKYEKLKAMIHLNWTSKAIQKTMQHNQLNNHPGSSEDFDQTNCNFNVY